MHYIWILLGVGLDQITKWFALKTHSIYVIQNRGAAWGMLSQYTDWLTIISGIISLYCLILLYYTDQPAWGIRLISMGAIGNLIDRLYHGAIIDFISIGRFPVFNVADSFITMGIAWLIFQAIYDSPAL